MYFLPSQWSAVSYLETSTLVEGTLALVFGVKITILATSYFVNKVYPPTILVHDTDADTS